jgi:hypothetical protein
MEKINRVDSVKNEEMLQSVKELNFLHTIQGRKANWNCHIFHRNFLLKHAVEGKIKRRENDEKDVNSHSVTLRKTEVTGI